MNAGGKGERSCWSVGAINLCRLIFSLKVVTAFSAVARLFTTAFLNPNPQAVTNLGRIQAKIETGKNLKRVLLDDNDLFPMSDMYFAQRPHPVFKVTENRKNPKWENGKINQKCCQKVS